MRVAQVIYTLAIGGLERGVIDLSLALKARGHDLWIVPFCQTGPFEAVAENGGLEVIPIGKRNGISPLAIRRLVAVFKRERIDIVHTHDTGPHHYGVVAARLAGVPVVVNTRHGLSNTPVDRRAELLFWLSSEITNAVVAVSHSVYCHLSPATGIPRSKWRVIHNGIPVEQFAFLGKKPRVRGIHFGTVGRLVPSKNHSLLLKAFKMCQTQLPDALLSILGDGPLRAQLEEESASLGLGDSVSFKGESLDVAGFLAQIDTFVLPSGSEGFSRALLEAMAAGLPVIATSVGGTPELIIDRVNGYLCPPDRAELLAKSMIAIAQDPASFKLSDEARSHVVRFHTIQGVALAYESLFRELLQQC